MFIFNKKKYQIFKFFNYLASLDLLNFLSKTEKFKSNLIKFKFYILLR